MNTSAWLPAPDVLPLPAPFPVLHLLLLLTFFLHVLFMNCLLGGVLLTAWSRLHSRTPGDKHARLADQYTKLLPSLVAGTVTFGVAPLLFLQVIFGQFFFSSSVIMAWPWFMVIPILLLAYYGTYVQSFAGQKLGTARLPLLVITAFLFASVGFIYSNNTTLMLRPERWGEIYFANSGGANLNLGEDMLWPRYLHMVLGAVAVAGLFVAWLGHLRRGTDSVQGVFMLRHGLTVFTWLTAANILIGLWFFMALARPVRQLMMGGSLAVTLLFGLGVVLAVALLGLVPRARSTCSTGYLGVATALALLTLVDMILLRDRIRAGYLAESFRPQDFPVEPQQFNLLLFAVLLVAGLATLFWMLRKLRRAW